MTKYTTEGQNILKVEGEWSLSHPGCFELANTGILMSNDDVYDTWEDARKKLIESALEDSKQALQALTEAQGRYDYFVNLKESV